MPVANRTPSSVTLAPHTLPPIARGPRTLPTTTRMFADPLIGMETVMVVPAAQMTSARGRVR